MKINVLTLFVACLFSCAPVPPSLSSTPANRVQNTIPTAFHGLHPDGPYSYTITASVIENYDGGKYAVKKVESLDRGNTCRVTVEASPTDQDVLTLQRASDGTMMITSRNRDAEWAKYQREGGEAPD